MLMCYPAAGTIKSPSSRYTFVFIAHGAQLPRNFTIVLQTQASLLRASNNSNYTNTYILQSATKYSMTGREVGLECKWKW